MKKPETNEPYGTYYWMQDGTKATNNLDGDDSRIIMDRAIPFIRNAADEGKPFLAVIWFHTPHAPVVAGPKYREMYSQYSEDEQHYYGCITALDEQMGRLRKQLRGLGVAGVPRSVSGTALASAEEEVQQAFDGGAAEP